MKIALALLLAVGLHAQTREVTDYGAYVIEASGRYTRFEGNDGVVVEYLYDTPRVDDVATGWRIRVNDKLVFSYRQTEDAIEVAGLPKLESVSDHQARTTSVLLDGNAIAQLEYTPDGYFAAATVPNRLRWRTSPPDASHRVRQVAEDASGRVIERTTVITEMFKDAVRRGELYDVIANELSVDAHELSYDYSSTNALMTARDAKGRVVFYVVLASHGDIGFSPEGQPLFYDVEFSPMGVDIAPGSDLNMPKALAQRGTLPDHLVWTVKGAVGLYAYESAQDALSSVWMDAEGKIHSTVVSVHK